MIDYFQEIFSTLKKNRLRAIMTGFSVAWGIFMLILLLGAGDGLQNGMENSFNGTSKNALWIWSGRTQKAHDGFKAGRRIKFTDSDLEAIQNEYAKDISNSSGRFYLWGQSVDITYKREYGNFSIEGVMPDLKNIQTVEMLDGRYINDLDIKDFRKVTIISNPVKKALFKDEDPIGKYLKVGSVPFMVVGVYDQPTNKDEKRLYLPLSTARKVFNGSNRLGEMAINTSSLSVDENKRIEESIRKTLEQRHHVSPDDKQALGIWNTLEHFKQAQGVFSGIKLFVWVIGIMTIMAGIVGVSNIMIILVKERTKEIGIRKAIGATPGSVVRLVLSESVIITALSGFFGLVFGMGALALASNYLQSMADQGKDIEKAFFNPSADLTVAITALVILIFAGLIAGYIPARKAAAIKPIEALHDE